MIHADTDNNDGQLNRETVYCDWAKQRFARYSVDVESIGLAGFRLAKQKRQTQTSKGKRAFRQIVRPQALLEGTVIIKDPVQFDLLLEKGMGRHCAFGYGMLLLDVYKRQGYTGGKIGSYRTLCPGRMRPSGGGQKTAAEPGQCLFGSNQQPHQGFQPDGTVPVSYTHLDVYKRQRI